MSIGKKKSIFIMGGLFFLIGTLCLVLLCDFYFKNSSTIDKNQELYQTSVDKNLFGMYVEDENGEYVEYTDSSYFPIDYNFNAEKSYCVNKNDQLLDGVLVYDNGKVTVTSNTTTYCYLYFDLVSCEEGMSLGECVHSIKTLGYNPNLEGGLYRYQGTSVDNYICFGTSDKDECLANTDAYMYRIIGVDENSRVKVIKKEALNSTVKWHSSSSSSATWPNSTLYSAINGSSFLTNSSYIPNGWEDKIETTTWKYGDNTNVNVTADSLYNTENAWANTVSAKIGLMYAHDYAYAYQSGGLNCSSSGSNSICKTSWIYLEQNDLGASGSGEWLMSRLGYDSTWDDYNAWFVDVGGSFSYMVLWEDYYTVRPVFYLTSDTLYASGSGTSTDPFIIS